LEARALARGVPAELNLNSEVNFGEVGFSHHRALKDKALYQGTASAVPDRIGEIEGL
jgi:hypothetical protein